MQLTRRLFGTAVLGGLVLPSLPTLARAPKSGAQAPAFYRIAVGDFEVTVLSDGYIPLETKIFGGDPAGAARVLEAEFLAKDATKTSVNEWLVNTGDRLVLVDAGASNVMGPSLGKLAANLKAAGVEPTAVDVVVLTHMHPDHASGLVTSGQMTFPNAILHVADKEYAFWTNDEIDGQAPPEAKLFFEMSRAAVKPYADAGRMSTFNDGAELIPGITAVSAPGHTPGHTMLRISSSGDDLILWGDIIHNGALQFAEPDRALAFDTDQPLAIATRKRVLDMASADRLLIAGSHLPFPGLGHVAKTPSGFRYVPTPWSSEL